jgi:hypothetical protein
MASRGVGIRIKAWMSSVAQEQALEARTVVHPTLDDLCSGEDGFKSDIAEPMSMTPTTRDWVDTIIQNPTPAAMPLTSVDDVPR